MLKFSDEDEEPPELAPDTAPLLHPIRVEHPVEFIRELTGITAPWVQAFGTQRAWFRGVPRLAFSLEPSLLRYRPRPLMQAESNLFAQFEQYAVRLLEHLPQTRLDLYAVMQHHGVPTRLLDWSENAFAALYFAVRESQYHQDDDDAVVWILEPARVTEISDGRKQILFAHDQLLDAYKWPMPFYPPHTSARLTPQRSAFTIHPFRPQHALVRLALQEVAEGRPSPLRALRIHGQKRAFIRDAMINAFGSGEFTFFPDLDGLGRELRMRERLEGRG